MRDVYKGVLYPQKVRKPQRRRQIRKATEQSRATGIVLQRHLIWYPDIPMHPQACLMDTPREWLTGMLNLTWPEGSISSYFPPQVPTWSSCAFPILFNSSFACLFVFKTWPNYLDQAHLELRIVLPQPLECWGLWVCTAMSNSQQHLNATNWRLKLEELTIGSPCLLTPLIQQCILSAFSTKCILSLIAFPSLSVLHQPDSLAPRASCSLPFHNAISTQL